MSDIALYFESTKITFGEKQVFWFNFSLQYMFNILRK